MDPEREDYADGEPPLPIQWGYSIAFVVIVLAIMLIVSVVIYFESFHRPN